METNRNIPRGAGHDIRLNLPGIRITDHHVTIAQRRFEITELTNLRKLRGPRDPIAVRTGLCTAVSAAGLIVLGGRLPATGLLGAAGSVVALAVISAVTAWRRPRGFALWADYRGVTLQLYYSDDERVFGHVCRSLIRAREYGLGAQIPNRPHYGRHATAVDLGRLTDPHSVTAPAEQVP